MGHAPANDDVSCCYIEPEEGRGCAALRGLPIPGRYIAPVSGTISSRRSSPSPSLRVSSPATSRNAM